MSSYESLEFTPKDLKFKVPSGIIVGGPSQSGKSTFIYKLITNVKEMFEPTPKTILYAYGQYDPRIHEFQKAGCKVMEGLPDDETLDKLEKPLVLILDDLMEAADSKYLQEMYTKKAHHKNMAVIFATQDLFNKDIRVARNNSQYLVLMRAPSAQNQIKSLGTQLFPHQAEYFDDAKNKATSKQFGYLMLDMHPQSHDALRLRSDIFPGEDNNVYLPLGAPKKRR